MPRTLFCLRRLLMPAAAALTLLLLFGRPALAQERLHVVAPGENLSTIAQRYGLTLGELSAYNGVVALAVVNAALRSIDNNGCLVKIAEVLGEAERQAGVRVQAA